MSRTSSAPSPALQGRQEEIDFKLAEVSNKVKGIKGVVEDKFGVDVEDLPQNLPEAPDEFFNLCQDTFKKGLKPQGPGSLQRVRQAIPPTHEKADDAQFMVGECYFAESRFEDAVIAYKQVYDNYQQGGPVPRSGAAHWPLLRTSQRLQKGTQNLRLRGKDIP